MRRAFVILACLPACFGWAQISRNPDSLVTAKRGLLVLEPKLIVSSYAHGISVSPDGRYLVSMRTKMPDAPMSIERPPSGPDGCEIVVWDSVTGVSRAIPLPKNAFPNTGTFEWFVGTDRALVNVSFNNYPVRDAQGQEMIIGFASEAYILDASDASLRLVRDSKDYATTGWRFVVSPFSPVAIEVSTAGLARAAVTATRAVTTLSPKTAPSRPVFKLRTLNADGKWGATVELPGTHSSLGRVGWSSDGAEALFECVVFGPEGTTPAPRVLHFVPSSGQFFDTTGAIETYIPPVPKSDVALDPKLTMLEVGTLKKTSTSWWLRSTEDSMRPVALVAEHADGAKLASGERFVAYAVNGAVFVRQIVEITLQQFEEMVLQSERMILMSNAKQVGLAAMMYMNDNDDNLPSDLDPRRDLLPYLRNESLLADFVWTFPGGHALDFKNPAETEMGHINSAGGRVVVYLDGHVKWVPDK